MRSRFSDEEKDSFTGFAPNPPKIMALLSWTILKRRNIFCFDTNMLAYYHKWLKIEARVKISFCFPFQAFNNDNSFFTGSDYRLTKFANMIERVREGKERKIVDPNPEEN